jgi:hypothetical protein
MTDRRAMLAARNNADWCDVVCRTHGIPTSFDDDMWTSLRRSPPMYPDAVALRETVTPSRLLDLIDTSAGCSVKDSFASLDLSPVGMRVLFEADWLYHQPDPPLTGRKHFTWNVVRTAEQLQQWAAAHGGGDVFRPGLLTEPDVAIMLARDTDGALACGAIANRSASAVGVSNVFTATEPDHAWPELVSAVSVQFPDLPIVGYERGESRTAALAAGFQPVGRLRVWLLD